MSHHQVEVGGPDAGVSRKVSRLSRKRVRADVESIGGTRDVDAARRGDARKSIGRIALNRHVVEDSIFVQIARIAYLRGRLVELEAKGIRLAYREESIQAIAAGAREVELLKIQPGAPLLLDAAIEETRRLLSPGTVGDRVVSSHAHAPGDCPDEQIAADVRRDVGRPVRAVHDA